MELKYKKLTVSPSAVFIPILLIFCPGIALPFIAGAVLHEFGHFCAISIFSGTVSEVKIDAAGLKIIYDAGKMSYIAEAVCALAGPLISLLSAVIFSYCGKISGKEIFLIYAGADFALFLFNIIPMSIFDGGYAVFCVLCIWLDPISVQRGFDVSDTVLAFLLSALSVMLLLSGKANISVLFIPFVMLFLCCKRFQNGVFFKK